MLVVSVHILVSLVAIVAGIGVCRDMLKGRLRGIWTKPFYGMILLTLLTSFLFPITGMTPGLAIAILGMVIFVPLAVTLLRPVFRTVWGRSAFVVGTLALFYFDCLVLVVQAFQKIPLLHAVAPTGQEVPVIVCQILVLSAFLYLGWAVLSAGVRRDQ
jgi:hypothetical protein